MSVRVVNGIEELRGLVGQQLGPSDWLLIDQQRIDAFARITEDDQWIHIDRERAAAGPFGTTVAHGYLTASLLPRLVRDVYRIEGVRSVVNMGSDRVRFPAPVPAESRVRARVEPLEVSVAEGGARLHSRVTIECDAAERPACVAVTVSRLYT